MRLFHPSALLIFQVRPGPLVTGENKARHSLCPSISAHSVDQTEHSR